MDNDLKDRNTFYTEVGLQIRDGDQLSLGPPQIVSPCTFLRATSRAGSRTSPMGVPDPQLHRWTFVHKLLHFVQIVRSQTHFYSAFRYGDQQGSVQCGDALYRGARDSVWRCSSTFPTILLLPLCSPVSWCPQILPPPSLSCVPSIFSTTPIGSGRVPPVFSSLRLLAPWFYASRTIERPTQRGANPDSGRVTPGPMTIQTMKAWNSFPCWVKPVLTPPPQGGAFIHPLSLKSLRVSIFQKIPLSENLCKCG